MSLGLDENQLWRKANQDLIARALSEFIYEEELAPQQIGDEQYQLTLGTSEYGFKATQTVWGLLDIETSSITRDQQSATDALTFCLDLKHSLQVDDIISGHWLEDVQNTLSNDFERLKNLNCHSAESLLSQPESQLQGLLDAHPKIVANRGRLGWGADDNQCYAPESLQQFQLVYLAADNELLTQGSDHDMDNRSLLLSMMSEQDLQRLTSDLESQRPHHTDISNYAVIPCHPWQYNHYIKTQFRWALQQKRLICLGTTGDYYQAQQSIRTLSNVSRPHQFDIKLAITILNTSCYRGVPEKFIAVGHKISSWLTHLTQQDELLRNHGLNILEEQAGYYFSHPYQNQIVGSPYRYHEMLGCIWRQSAASKIKHRVEDRVEHRNKHHNEQQLLLSALLQKDLSGHALIKSLIESSQLSVEDWLRQLFQVMSVPLYHLLVKYGVGVIAHGQNVVVYFKDSVPYAIAIKDFHGDLRLLDQALPEQEALAADAKSRLTKLPAEHLVHDLLTGHFISVYRFLSPLIEQQLGFKESDFYQLVAEALFDYQQQHPQYAERFQWFDPFRAQVERVCLNKVRFKIGYEDNAERPLPSLASPLNNPIHQGLQRVLLKTKEQKHDTTTNFHPNAVHPTTAPQETLS